MSSNAIEIRGLKKTYANGVNALRGVDLTVRAGDFFALLGANGAGKTTIIGILTGLVNKTAGSAKIFGHDIDGDHDAGKRMIGVVPQETNFSIFENVMDIVVQQAGYFGVPRKEALSRAERVLKAMELWEKRGSSAMQLSGGMKRRLMIARALIHDPKLLILDEPTAGVDVELRHGMWEYLKELNRKGTTILLTTHYLEEAEAMCKNVAIIKTGEIVVAEPMRELLKSMEVQTYRVSVRTHTSLESFEAGVNLRRFACQRVDEHTLEIQVKKDQNISSLINDLDKAGITVEDIAPKGNRLEQLFLNLMRK